MAGVIGFQLFYTIDLIFGIVSALVALLVAGYAFRGHKYSRNRTSLFFTISFFFITLGLLSRVVFDYLAKFELTYNIHFFPSILSAPFIYGLLATSVFFVSAGYSLLIALFFKIQSKRIIFLLLALIGLLSININDYYTQVHIIPTILLFFVQLHTIEYYVKKRTKNTLLVLASFFLLFISEIFFLMIELSINFYFIGNTLRVIGFLLLLANLFLVYKR
jgi:hypothetical protein